MIRCLGCGTDNAEDSSFCIECAAELLRRCPQCRTDNVPRAKFCRKCAAGLARDPEVEGSSGTPPSPADAGRRGEDSGMAPSGGAERRHLTVLMSDLVDSTRIAASLDPEDWREIVTRCARVAADAATRCGGYVARFLGDGLLVYFGYPEAHEDSVERAVRAGLAIVDAVATLNLALAAEHRPLLKIRVGIDAGAVVVGSGGGVESDVFGDTPNVAARVQALAEPDSVLVTGAVERLVTGRFVVEDRGAHELKGIAIPVRLYRVVEPSGVRGRLQAEGAAHGLTHFVGRDDELEMLQRRWNRVCAGEGQVVMVVGEAGVGKSRLVQQFREQIADAPHQWWESGGVSTVPSAPFDALVPLLEQAVPWGGATAADDRRAALERALAAAGLPLPEAVPLIAPLLNVPVPDTYPTSMLPPEDRRRQLLATLARWVFAAATRQPLVVAIEDLHWIDSSTIDLQQLLADRGATCRLLLIYTARPEFRPPWPLRAHHLQINLNRLSHREAREMARQVSGGSSLANEVVDAVVERANGVPLFVEELTRLVVERGEDVVAAAIPATLQDSLMARLDRLGHAKEVVQVGAVIGREFSSQLLQAVLPMADGPLQAALAKATNAELLYARGSPPDTVYGFKHSLVQDVAYQALLKARRRELHGIIARVLNERFSTWAAAHPERLAHHHAEAGEVEQGAMAWQRAGDLALTRGALKEAEHCFASAVRLLDDATATAGLEHHQLVAQVALGQVLMATRGYASPEVRAAYARAEDLGRRVGDPAQVVFTLMGLWMSSFIRCELRAAQAIADHVLAVAEAHGSLRIWGRLANGITCYHRGDLPTARAHLENAASMYREGFYNAVPTDPGVASLGYAGRTAWQLGLTDDARGRVRGALELAQRLNKPFDLASAYSFAAGLHLLLDEPNRALDHAERLLTVATDHHMPFYLADGHILKGRALAQLHRSADGITMMRGGVREQIVNGQRLGLGYYLALLSEVQMQIGALDDALASVEEALTAVPEEVVEHPRLLHVRGAVHLRLAALADEPHADEHRRAGERSLREAVALATSIGATMPALRAATLLAAALNSDGRAREAHDVLSPLHGALPDGFDVSARHEARAVLAGLRE